MRPFVLLFPGALMLAAACGGKVSGGVDQDGGPSSSGSSGSGGSSSSSGGGFNSCFETSGSPPDCIACVESQCGSELSAAESGCSALLTCECPGGVYSQAAAEMCSSMAEAPSCTGPVEQLSTCETQSCASPCGAVSSSGGGSSSSGGGSGGGSGGPTPPGCTADTTIDCSGGAIGYACAIGDNPESLNPELSCSTPGPTSDGEVDFCCFFGGSWSPTTCVPDDELTSLCPDPTSYGYQCSSGDDPMALDAQLACSTTAPDADGVHDDYCCTYE